MGNVSYGKAAGTYLESTTVHNWGLGGGNFNGGFSKKAVLEDNVQIR